MRAAKGQTYQRGVQALVTEGLTKAVSGAGAKMIEVYWGDNVIAGDV